MKMILLLVTLLMLLTGSVSGLSCYSCSGSSFDGEPHLASGCYSIDGSTTRLPCPNNSYCRTEFGFRDGIAFRMTRGCAQGTSDADSSTDSMPLDNKCTTNLAPRYRAFDTTTCYYHCNSSDDCNSVSLSTLKICGSDCGRRTNMGYCDYISGKCKCNSRATGLECSNRLPASAPSLRRKCVQCNSETDKGCTTKKDAVSCPGSELYCSSTQTSIFKAGKVVRRILIRGCTSNHLAVDECKFTDIYSDDGIVNQGYYEYTCYSTCDTDGCNTNTPNGRLDKGEKPLLKCIQCRSSDYDCSAARSFCPSGSTHCKTTVNYFIADKVDASYKAETPGSYKLMSVVRECATSPVTAECTESAVGDLTFKNVTCQETCQDDGCNQGWPARPKCIRCSGISTSTCFKSPSEASACRYPYDKYCVIKDSGLEEGSVATLEGYPRSIIRSCSYVDIGSGCDKVTIRDKAIQSCNYTCSTDGCNAGSGSDSFKKIGHTTVMLVFVNTVWKLGW